MTDATATRIDAGDTSAVTNALATLKDSALARWVAGLLLLAAAFLKWRQAYLFADFGGFEPWHKPGTILLIAGEILLAFWLVCGVMPAVTKWVAVAVFSGFAIHNAYRWLGGYATCGCFGAVKVDPRITLGVDVAIVALFLLSRTPRLGSVEWRVEKRVLRVVTAAGLVVGVLAGITVATVEPTRLGVDGLAGAEGRFIRLEPEAWLGQRLPLLPYIEGTDADVSKGKWVVVMWHPDCGHCRAALPGLVEHARATGDSTLLLNVSTRDEGQEFWAAVAATASLHAARLDPSYRWSAATPTTLVVSDAILTDVQ